VNAWWQYFWPAIAAGVIAGVAAGLYGFRRRQERPAMLIGALVAVAAALIWHGPLGAGERLAGAVEGKARAVLVDWEMGKVSAHLQRGPLTRRLELSGPADSFQRSSLVQLMELVPGVRSATWGKGHARPLALEGALAALLGCLVGLLLAYLVELRRRHNAQWTW
jgi:hypothetical protein